MRDSCARLVVVVEAGANRFWRDWASQTSMRLEERWPKFENVSLTQSTFANADERRWFQFWLDVLMYFIEILRLERDTALPCLFLDVIDKRQNFP